MPSLRLKSVGMSVFRLMLSHSLPSRTRTDPLLLSQKQKLPAHEWQDIRTTAQIAQVTQNSNHLKKRKQSPRASQKSSSSPVRTSTDLYQCCSLSCIHIIRRPRSLESDYPFLARGLGAQKRSKKEANTTIFSLTNIKSKRHVRHDPKTRTSAKRNQRMPQKGSISNF